MEKLRFFDCSLSYGRRSSVLPGSFYRLEDLLDRMDDYGIEEGLVYHALSQEYAPEIGNQAVLEVKSYQNRLHPVWSTVPTHTGEYLPPEQLLAQMKLEDVRAVRLFHETEWQAFCLEEWNCGDLFSALEDCSVPLFITYDPSKWGEYGRLMQNHPKLSLVLCGVNYRIDRNLYGAMKAFPHLYVETFGYKVHRGIENLVQAFGADRLLFGSGMPVSSGASAVAMVSYAQLPRIDKEKIAGENLRQLLGGVCL